MPASGVAFDFLGVTRGLSQGLGYCDPPAKPRRSSNQCDIVRYAEHQTLRLIKHTHSPDSRRLLGLLEVSSNTSCRVLVSGAVLQSILMVRTMYTVVLPWVVEVVCRFDFCPRGRLSLISLQVRDLFPTCIGLGPLLQTNPHLSRAPPEFPAIHKLW